MIVAQAFFPPLQLDDSFEAISQAIPDRFLGEFQGLLDCFEDNYLGRMGRNNRRREPMFSSRIWLGFLIFTLVVNYIRSVHERVLNNQDRTNNYCEAAHKRMNRELCMEHPTLWKFIEGLKRVQKNRDKLYEEFVRGDEAEKNEWFTRKRMNASERLLWRDLGSVLLLNICVGLQQILIWINNFFAHFHVRSFIFCCFFYLVRFSMFCCGFRSFYLPIER